MNPLKANQWPNVSGDKMAWDHDPPLRRVRSPTNHPPGDFGSCELSRERTPIVDLPWRHGERDRLLTLGKLASGGVEDLAPGPRRVGTRHVLLVGAGGPRAPLNELHKCRFAYYRKSE